MSHCHTILASLRSRGYRITPQREMVIEAIAHADRHMSAEEVFAGLQKRTQTTNLATVYRTLEMLWEEGLACRNDLGEGRIVYATYKHGPHIHLVCRQCNRVIDADPAILEPLGEALETRHNFAPDLRHLSIFGICADCRA